MNMAHRRLPPINAIRVFEAAARLESFTRAGEELGMTQAAVSYQIKVLEERLGYPLFVRETRRVSLTPRGRQLSIAATEAFRTLEAAFAATTESAETLLTITTTPSFSANWLAPRLGGFQIAHPHLAVRVDTSIRVIDLLREDMDIAVRWGDGNWPGLEAHFLMEDAMTVLVTARAAAQFGPFTHPRDLLKLRLIGWIDGWRRWFAQTDVPLSALPERPALEFETQQMEVNAALSIGDAAVIVSPRYFERELQAGLLVRPFPVELGGNHIWVVYDRSRRRSPKIRDFVSWIRAEVAADAKADASNTAAAGLSTPA
jgi:LysR family glycine cleavage system transcriptional activator